MKFYDIFAIYCVTNSVTTLSLQISIKDLLLCEALSVNSPVRLDAVLSGKAHEAKTQGYVQVCKQTRGFNMF